MLGQPLIEHGSFPCGPAGDRLGLHVPRLPTPFEPALYGGHRHREGLSDLLPGRAGIDGREHPQPQILRIRFHARRLPHHGSILTGVAVRSSYGLSPILIGLSDAFPHTWRIILRLVTDLE